MLGQRGGPQLCAVLLVPTGDVWPSRLPTRGLNFSLKWGLFRTVALDWFRLAQGLPTFRNLVSASPQRMGKETGPGRAETCRYHTA